MSADKSVFCCSSTTSLYSQCPKPIFLRKAACILTWIAAVGVVLWVLCSRARRCRTSSGHGFTSLNTFWDIKSVYKVINIENKLFGSGIRPGVKVRGHDASKGFVFWEDVFIVEVFAGETSYIWLGLSLAIGVGTGQITHTRTL